MKDFKGEEIIDVKEKVKPIKGTTHSSIENRDRFRAEAFAKKVKSLVGDKLKNEDIAHISHQLFHGKEYDIETVNEKRLLECVKNKTEKRTNVLGEKVITNEVGNVLLGKEEIANVLENGGSIKQPVAVYKRSTELGSSFGVNSSKDTVVIYIPGNKEFKRSGSLFKL